MILAPVLCGDENVFALEFSFGHLVRQAAAIIGRVKTTLRAARVQLENVE